MKLSALLDKSAELDVEYADETIHIRFAPHRYTAKVNGEMMGVRNDPEMEALINVLDQLLLDWDFTDDKGVKMPVSKETLSQLPLPLLMQMATSIMSDVSGSKNVPTSPAS